MLRNQPLRDRPLWTGEALDYHRAQAAPELTRVVVGIDPPYTNRDRGALVVAGVSKERRVYVLSEHETSHGAVATIEHAIRVAYEGFIRELVCEDGAAREMVRTMAYRIGGHGIHVRFVRLRGGRWLRSEAVAALYAEGRVSHVGRLPKLEHEMRWLGSGEPLDFDYLDPMLVAVHALMFDRPTPHLRNL